MKETPPKILIIDDEEAMRDSCSQVLKRMDIDVENAPNGEEGLEKIKAFEPHLVLLDLKMPGISGMQILEKLPDMDPFLIPVVITGYATVESAVEAMKHGAYDYLPKPFTPDKLRMIVKRGLERRRYMVETERLQEEKKMMRKNFVSMVSHELKSPLAAVQQNLIVIIDGMAGEIPKKPKQMLKRASIRIKGLLTLINDWLNLSRMESGEMVQKMEPVDLKALLEELVELLHPLADEKNVTLRLNVPNEYPTILGEKETLQMLFTNLIHNGIKYNRENGRVLITLENENQMTRVSVKDTGVGIPKDKLPMIFDQFYRVKEVNSEPVEGSGLGLSIVKKIVDAHSGTIEVESELGEGTTFTVRLQ